jgi:single-stranded-DNA-specific exonuclease
MRTKEWRIYGQKVDFNGYAKELGVSPMTVRIMCNRGLRTVDEMKKFLQPDEQDLHEPLLMKDMEKAVGILISKIRAGARIRIVGDYDIDGVCSTAILCKGLRQAGADVDWYIPHRVTDGYGLNLRIVEQAVEDGIDTLLTCDNGISAREEVTFAKKQHMTVIVTDHHDIPSAGIPEADAVVNPKQQDCTYPFKGLCGAGVAWKLVQALFAALQMDLKPVREMVDLAAVATVGDVMDLQGENRLIVQLGLKQISHTKHAGLAALMEACELNPATIGSYHIGFVLGPTINAGGRLETAALAENLMLCDVIDEKTQEQAAYLKELNDSRKSMTQNSVEEAISMVDESSMADDSVLVVYLKSCSESIAGIVAGRLREHYYKPCIVLTDSAEEGMAKGSGRSIPGYEMFQELERVSTLLTRFGGHPMAAGLSLKKEHISELRKSLNANCTLTPAQLTERLWIDIALPISRISLDWIRQLHLLEPFGKGNEKPLFADRNIRILRGFLLGRERSVLKLLIESEDGCRMEALLFHEKDAFLEELEHCYGAEAAARLYGGYDAAENPTCMSMVYEPSINDYRGVQTIQVVIQDFHLHRKSENV